MFRLFIVLFLMLGIGCTKGSNPVCEAGKLIAKPVAVGVGKMLECEAPAELELWMVGKLESLKVCEPKSGISKESWIGEWICPQFIDGIIAGGLDQLPVKAKCKGGKFADDAKAELMRICVGAI